MSQFCIPFAINVTLSLGQTRQKLFVLSVENVHSVQLQTQTHPSDEQASRASSTQLLHDLLSLCLEFSCLPHVNSI